jgi:D-alanyl-D-alanine carboxypeptidase/D-alanyl-D-alanine-endopeptidase (penicillin-binding protein 4)
MQNAGTVVSPPAGGVNRTITVLAFCILHSAFLSCSKVSPTTAPGSSTARPALEQLRRDITQATQAPGVQRGVWGVVVHSLDRNERLFELQPRTLLVPASVAKLAAVATAAEAVGWDYRYETTLRATGPVTDGVLVGDLLVVGSGDPTIGGRAGEDFSNWVAALTQAGIRRIDGRIIGDDDAVEEPRPQLAWAWDDLGYPSGVLFGALNYAENRMTVTITPGPTAGAAVSLGVDPQAASRPLVNRVVTGVAGTPQLVWPEQQPGEPFLTIAGSIPVGAQPARLAVAVGNPTIWFASILRHRLQAQGIEVSGEAWDADNVRPPVDRARAHVLFTHRSRPLRDIVQPLLKDSLNLYAEAVMRLNAAPGPLPTNDAALEGFGKRLAAWGIPSLSQQLVDGSGLSRRDTVSPETVLAVLQHMYDPSGSSPFITALPVAGVDGTLSERMRNTPAAGNVRAKTGTMSNIRSLAGYVKTRDGETLAFVTMVNNFEGAGAAANQALDAIAASLAAFSRAQVSGPATGSSK